MSDQMSTHAVLCAAKGYLLNHGWHQGGSGHHGGPRCVIGAVSSALDGLAFGAITALPVYEVLLEATGAENQSLGSGWNDDPGRTFDDVIAAMDRAILATAPPRDNTPIFQALESLPAEDYIEALSVLALIPAEALA